MRNNSGFTWIEAVVVVILVVLLIGLLGSVLKVDHRSDKIFSNSTQVRSIQQGHILFSEGNNGYYAGFTRDGDLAEALAVVAGKSYGAERKLGSLSMAVLLNGNYITPEYLINPAESNPDIKALSTPGLITPNHYSYAVSRAVAPEADAGRITEWRDNRNADAAVISDRAMMGKAEAGSGHAVPIKLQRSLWTNKDGKWEGKADEPCEAPC